MKKKHVCSELKVPSWKPIVMEIYYKDILFYIYETKWDFNDLNLVGYRIITVCFAYDTIKLYTLQLDFYYTREDFSTVSAMEQETLPFERTLLHFCFVILFPYTYMLQCYFPSIFKKAFVQYGTV